MNTSRRGTADAAIKVLTASVARRIDAVVEVLTDVAAGVPPAASDFDYFAAVTRELLMREATRSSLAGAGYAVEYADPVRAPAMVWWVRRGGSIAERTHSVDPESESFYDYAALRWFTAAKDTGAPTLSGPFIDTWGADDYTVTVSLPVSNDSTLLGVIAVDVDVRRFIESLTAEMAEISAPLALVNESDRVVVSTEPSLSTGLPIRPRAARDEPDLPSTRRYPVSGYGWSVVRFGR
ncbi:cache domain-containing protein [Mycolicibacterium sediminis]|uniref:Cache domain-containing protein n=1 Tax=Mycolicibacterium sediminis TaxID=1286180 RepID=A0A7I7QQD0_9MYCO|nr:cache domain-containing protein [Mycolicibacterium sediminis]BBY28504.1 hypothetical protein MSEDJ_26000 [Mycolicibacterium sediminis]